MHGNQKSMWSRRSADGVTENSVFHRNANPRSNTAIGGPKRAHFSLLNTPGQNAGMNPRKMKIAELSEDTCGIAVEIAGKVRSNRQNRFMLLKDETAAVQIVAPSYRVDLVNRMNGIPVDSYIVVIGEVKSRPADAKNDKVALGSIEVHISDIIKVHTNKRKSDANGGVDDSKKAKLTSSLKLTSEEVVKAENEAIKSYFMARTHTCGDINEDVVGERVLMCGWVAIKRTKIIFTFKDGTGDIQMVTHQTDVLKDVQPLTPGCLVFVEGELVWRPRAQQNTTTPNGRFEVYVRKCTTVTKKSPKYNSASEQTSSVVAVIEETKTPTPAQSTASTVKTAAPTVKCMESKPTVSGELTPQYSKYTKRTHTCGDLRKSHVGQTVKLLGWVEFVRMTKFILIRDAYGTTQILINEKNAAMNDLVPKLSLESVVTVTGVVCSRPPSQVKKEMATGEIEVMATAITQLNAAGELPFSIRNYNKPQEPLRMQYRYLDLRFEELQRNLRMRSSVLMKMREFLIHRAGFVEVETPTLFKKTPGGAREFVVPTHTPGQFYSLVQSPQQLKQLLMVGSMDRYFQIARCYRDESTRPDRQPEFTQLDIEMTFCDKNGVMSLIEDLLKHSWDGDLVTPFHRMTYTEAMETYGTDKPDVRFAWKLTDITNDFKLTTTDVLKRLMGEYKHSFGAYCIVVPKGAGVLTATYEKAFMDEAAKKFPQVILRCSNILNMNQWKEELKECYGPELCEALIKKLKPSTGCSVFIGIGHKPQVLPCLGNIRTQFADIMEEKSLISRPKQVFNFLWVVDFPLFATDEIKGEIEANHHPFTAPVPEHESLLFEKPVETIGQHYDLVLNGHEVGGGSIRIHNGEIQERVLRDILNLPAEPMSHLITALKSGAPPHGGIALGIDRLLACMTGSPSIRDVIAFPKSTDGRDPLSGAPDLLSEEDRSYYHLT